MCRLSRPRVSSARELSACVSAVSSGPYVSEQTLHAAITYPE